MLNCLIASNKYPPPQTSSPTHQWACSLNYCENLLKGNHWHGCYYSNRITHVRRQSHQHIDIKCGWKKNCKVTTKVAYNLRLRGYNEISTSIIDKIRKLVMLLDKICVELVFQLEPKLDLNKKQDATLTHILSQSSRIMTNATNLYIDG